MDGRAVGGDGVPKDPEASWEPEPSTLPDRAETLERDPSGGN